MNAKTLITAAVSIAVTISLAVFTARVALVIDFNPTDAIASVRQPGSQTSVLRLVDYSFTFHKLQLAQCSSSEQQMLVEDINLVVLFAPPNLA